MSLILTHFFCFFFTDAATTEIYTLSLHDALPICCFLNRHRGRQRFVASEVRNKACNSTTYVCEDRKSTRLNSSHTVISYAVFCLKKKKNNKENYHTVSHYT